MPDRGFAARPATHYGMWAALYAAVIAYVSLMLGPVGMHYVPLTADVAWHRFLAVRFMATGSDQRSDWMGNVAMLVPLGFLVAGSLWPRVGGGRGLQVVAALATLAICTAFILAVKYAQLFFPPRTVSLNYITAQGIGSLLGIGMFAGLRVRLALLPGRRFPDGREGLILILQIYLALLLAFLLVPFDFAISPADLQACFAQLPHELLELPGAGRPPGVRAAVMLASTVAAMPFGALLVLTARRRPIASAIYLGFLTMLGVTLMSALLMTGRPLLAGLAYRTLGIAAGAWLMSWLLRQDIRRLRAWLPRLANLLLLPYLVVLAYVNHLLTYQWRTPEQALAAVYDRGLVPLYYYYIVSKPEAAKNVAAHVVMYAPVGLLVWMYGLRSGSRLAAFVVAVLLAACVELGRWLQPGRQPDVNALLVAGISASLAAGWMPFVWRLLESVVIGRRIAGGLRPDPPPRPIRAPATNDVEYY